MLTLLDFENAILDLFEKNIITIQDAKVVLWILLTAIYEDELIEDPRRRETIIENIERQKEHLLVNIYRDKPLSFWFINIIIMAHIWVLRECGHLP